MALVDYSDSEDSDALETNVKKPSTTSSGKPAFQKVVDRSNPGKIKVSLPQTALKEEDTSKEPPTKRTKTGGGAFGGFNSFLPAPKRTGQATGTALGGGSAARKGGLAAGVSLKTGAAPGFSREPEPEREHEVEEDTTKNQDVEPAEGGSEMGLTPPKSLVDEQKPPEEVKLVGKPLMFRPLSVARKPVKKKPLKLSTVTSTPVTGTARDSPFTPGTPQNDSNPTATPQPKVSLFSLEVESVANTPTTSTPSSGVYQPLLYQPSPSTTSNPQPTYESSSTPTTPHFAHLPSVPTPPLNANFDSLHTIADSLHLSAAERRQLFGRNNKNNAQATKIINFNTDEEYKHNEELRQAGEQVVHNPVRAIAPGKHSLKQLVTAAQSQKEALEESFASGRNNRKEAGSKYGW
ncbi:hypothetical protein ACMFMG_004394 [Clarireedia jacksonii]